MRERQGRVQGDLSPSPTQKPPVSENSAKENRFPVATRRQCPFDKWGRGLDPCCSTAALYGLALHSPGEQSLLLLPCPGPVEATCGVLAWVPGQASPWVGQGSEGPGALGSVLTCCALLALPQVIQQPPKPGALIRPPQVTLTQTPMVALRQPHNRIMLTTPQQIQLNQLQPGEGRPASEGPPPRCR